MGDRYLNIWTQAYRELSVYWGNEPTSLIQFTPIPRNGKSLALDLGCGQGRNIMPLVNSGFRVIGVDLIPEALDSIIKNSHKEIYPVCSDVLDFLPRQKSEYVEFILANHLIQHLKSLSQLDLFFSNAKRVLRISGVIALAYFTEPHFLHPDYVQENALLLPPGFILERYFPSSHYDILHTSWSIKNDYHGGDRHKHAIEKLVVKKLPNPKNKNKRKLVSGSELSHCMF